MGDNNKPPPTGWFWLDNRVVKRIAEIGPTAFAVYALLARFSENRECSISKEKVAVLIRRTTKTVQTAIRALADAALVSITPRRNAAGADQTNVYRILPLPPQEPGEAYFTPGGETSFPRGGEPASPIQDYPSQDKKARAPSNGAGYPSDFEAFWKVYPRRTAKKAAYPAWKRAVKTIQQERHCDQAVAVARLLEVTEMFSRSDTGQGDPKYVPYPTTWLNQGRYADDPAEWQHDRSGQEHHTSKELPLL